MGYDLKRQHDEEIHKELYRQITEGETSTLPPLADGDYFTEPYLAAMIYLLNQAHGRIENLALRVQLLEDERDNTGG